MKIVKSMFITIVIIIGACTLGAAQNSSAAKPRELSLKLEAQEKEVSPGGIVHLRVILLNETRMVIMVPRYLAADNHGNYPVVLEVFDSAGKLVQPPVFSDVLPRQDRRNQELMPLESEHMYGTLEELFAPAIPGRYMLQASFKSPQSDCSHPKPIKAEPIWFTVKDKD